MKFLQFFKRRRRGEEKILAKKKSGGDVTSSTAGDETSSTESRDDSVATAVVALPVWSAENFLMNGPLGDSDWWEKNSNDDGSSAKDDGESTTSEIPQEEGEEVTSNEQPFKGKRFCNRGLQTWSLARQAWIAEGRGSGNELPKAPPIPASFKSELVKCLADRRHFELSQRISLHCLIDSYQEVWNDGASE